MKIPAHMEYALDRLGVVRVVDVTWTPRPVDVVWMPSDDNKEPPF